MSSRLILGGISAVVWLVTFAAADDITTGNEPDFRLEYAFLLVFACWFAFVTIRLFRSRMVLLGLVSAIALLAAVWGRGAIRPGIVPGLRLEYVVPTAAFLWFGVLSLVLIASAIARVARAGPA